MFKLQRKAIEVKRLPDETDYDFNLRRKRIVYKRCQTHGLGLKCTRTDGHTGPHWNPKVGGWR